MAKKKNNTLLIVTIFVIAVVLVSVSLFTLYIQYMTNPRATHGLNITYYNEKMQRIDSSGTQTTFSVVNKVENVYFFDITYFMTSGTNLDYSVNVISFPFGKDKIVEGGGENSYIQLPNKYVRSFGVIDANKITTGDYPIKVELTYKLFGADKTSTLDYTLHVTQDKQFSLLKDNESNPIITEADVCTTGDGVWNAFGKTCSCVSGNRWNPYSMACEEDLSSSLLIFRTGKTDLSEKKLTHNDNNIVYVNDKFNDSMLFDGTASIDYHTNSLDFDTKPFTIMFWMKPNQPHNAGLVTKSTINNSGYGVYLSYPSEASISKGAVSQVYFYLNDNKNNQANVTALIKSETLSWYHIAVTRDGNYVKIYVNGNLESQSSVSLVNVTSIGSLFIGKGTYGFHGYINNVRVYNQSLTTKQISNIYVNENALKIW